MGGIDAGRDLSGALEASERASPVDAVSAVTARVAAALDVEDVSFLIADLSGRALVRLSDGPHHTVGDPSVKGTRQQAKESAEIVPFSDAAVADVLRRQEAAATPTTDGWRVLAPVTQRGEVIGLLEVLMMTEPDAADLDLLRRAAHILAFVVIANRRHTDLFEWGQRTAPFELSAEIQRRLLPAAYTCEAGQFTLSAWLEPASTIGGDSFDYSLERDLLHLSVTDAMGHGVSAALTATICVGSLRNTRRVGASLPEQAAAADAAILAHMPRAFVTGVLGRIDLTSGVLQLVNAGHVLPLLQRGESISEIALPANRPFGLARGCPYADTDVQLQPHDRFLIVTDGMLEREASALDLHDAVRRSRHLHPREAARFLADSVLEVAGHALADDAALLIVDWHGVRELAPAVASADL